MGNWLLTVQGAHGILAPEMLEEAVWKSLEPFLETGPLGELETGMACKEIHNQATVHMDSQKLHRIQQGIGWQQHGPAEIYAY